MRTIYLSSILLLLTLSGCHNKDKNNYVSNSLKDTTIISGQTASNQHKKNIQNATSQVSKHQTITPANVRTMPPIGIKVDKNQIIIDTNQTRKFLESLTNKLDQSLKKVTNDLKKNRISSPNDIGIVVTKDRIEVDLNKTQKFMDKWIRSMETIGKQLDSVSKELDQSLSH